MWLAGFPLLDCPLVRARVRIGLLLLPDNGFALAHGYGVATATTARGQKRYSYDGDERYRAYGQVERVYAGGALDGCTAFLRGSRCRGRPAAVTLRALRRLALLRRASCAAAVLSESRHGQSHDENQYR